MNNYKLEKGKVLRKCKVCEGVGTWWAQPELPEHPYEVMCNECKGGYIEYKEPEPFGLYIAEYRTQLKHWQEVKGLLEVEKPEDLLEIEIGDGIVEGVHAYEYDLWIQAEQKLETLYKEHNV